MILIFPKKGNVWKNLEVTLIVLHMARGAQVIFQRSPRLTRRTPSLEPVKSFFAKNSVNSPNLMVNLRKDNIAGSNIENNGVAIEPATETNMPRHRSSLNGSTDSVGNLGSTYRLLPQETEAMLGLNVFASMASLQAEEDAASATNNSTSQVNSDGTNHADYTIVITNSFPSSRRRRRHGW